MARTTLRAEGSTEAVEPELGASQETAFGPSHAPGSRVTVLCLYSRRARGARTGLCRTPGKGGGGGDTLKSRDRSPVGRGLVWLDGRRPSKRAPSPHMAIMRSNPSCPSLAIFPLTGGKFFFPNPCKMAASSTIFLSELLGGVRIRPKVCGGAPGGSWYGCGGE